MYFRSILKLQVRHKHNWGPPEGLDTGIKIYNCVAKDKVPLILRNKNFTSWYTCGPTVYDPAHIGHASCYVKLDIIQRILRTHFNINLITVMNVTDIDDKIIAKSTATHISPIEIARGYEKEFWEDFQSLNIVKPNVVLRVTENISLISKYIKQLLDDEKAYVGSDKSVYFDVNSTTYGKLQPVGDLNQTDPTGIKKSAADFALWKAAKPGEPFWESKHFGPGRPGWHIECSTLASSLFGSTIDIHAGGIDLKFPHHENEEAQSCAYFHSKQWVNYWIHTGHLLTKNTKMSKSLKNTVTIQELLEAADSDTFRMACLLSNYRNNMEFTKEFLLGAKTIIKSYCYFIANCNAFIKGQVKCTMDAPILIKALNDCVEAVDSSLKDDFDTASVMKHLNTLTNVTSKMLSSKITPENNGSNMSSVAPVLAIVNYVVDVFNMFGLNLSSTTNVSNDEQKEIGEVLDVLVNFRQNVRNCGLTNKDGELLKLCDEVRNELKKYDITINDRGKESTWSR